VLCGVGAIHAGEPPKHETAAVDELRQKVSDLSAENKSLRDQVDKLQEQVKRLRSRAIVQMQPGQPGRQVPNNWVPHEFNGTTCYLIPLATNQARQQNPR
jgi:cell division septum initiation protein DivIVA